MSAFLRVARWLTTTSSGMASTGAAILATAVTLPLLVPGGIFLAYIACGVVVAFDQPPKPKDATAAAVRRLFNEEAKR